MLSFRSPSVLSKSFVHQKFNVLKKILPARLQHDLIKAQRINEGKISELNFKAGSVIENFKVIDINSVPEYNLTAVRLTHEKTGTKYVHLLREDNNNTFAVFFRTTPFDSTGLPHILEHTTLCGSQLYPCRDPFFKMLNRSMATFMNAFTGPDYTFYPFSTQNRMDFRNLMSVYLDAVFNPLLKEIDFNQEGWRLENEDINQPSSPIIIKGVVYNEMKGVYSDNTNIYARKFLSSILPSNAYKYDYGGDPLQIPNLSYQQLVDFHAKYYNAANSVMYSYGNFPLENHLKFIDKLILSNVKVIPDFRKQTAVPSEERWTEPRREHIYSRFDPMAANPNKQAYITIGTLCSDVTDIEETFDLQFLAELLVKGPNSSFYKSLVEPNIGAGFAPTTGFESYTKDTFFAVGLQGVSEEDFDKILEIYDKTVDEVIEKGFSQTHIDTVLHNIEISMKHQPSDFGLGLLFGLSSVLNHDGDAVKALKVNDQVRRLKGNLKTNPSFLKDKMKKYFKDNKHKLILTMSPDKNYENNQIQAEKNLLAQKVSRLNDDDKKHILERGIQLVKEQSKVDSETCLPTINVKDLPKTVEEISLSKKMMSSIRVQICNHPTNGVTYIRSVLSSKNLNEEQKALLPLFCQVVTKMGTGKRDYRNLDELINLKTGGLSFYTHLANNTNQRLTKFEEGIVLSSFCLDQNLSDMFKLIEEILVDVSFKDEERLSKLIKISAADLVQGVIVNGHGYAMSSAASLLGGSALRSEISSGLTFVNKMKELAQQSDVPRLLAELKEIASKLFNKSIMRSSVNTSPENEINSANLIQKFLDKVPGTVEGRYYQTEIEEKKGRIERSKHHLLPIPVNYSAKSIATVPYEHPDYAPLQILARLLSLKYLHPRIREQGGAYGSGANISLSGVFTFYSYRDPKPINSFDVFDEAASWINQKGFSNKDIDEAKLGVFQKLDAPVPPSDKGMKNFLYGLSNELRQTHRDNLMSVKMDDIIDVASVYIQKDYQSCGRALIGPENSDLLKRSNENWDVIQA